METLSPKEIGSPSYRPLMISLNLLSDQKKEDVRKKILLEFATNILEILLIIIIFVAVIFLISKIILQNSFNDAVAQGALITASYGALNQEIGQTNKGIDQIYRLEKDQIFWSDLLFHISVATPQAMTLKSLALNSRDKRAEISGRAATRNALLAFIKNLEDLGVFLKIESPLSNIFERTDINFTLSAVLDKAKITKLHSH